MQMETTILCNLKPYSLVYNSDKRRWQAIFIFITSSAEGIDIFLQMSKSQSFNRIGPTPHLLANDWKFSS